MLKSLNSKSHLAPWASGKRLQAGGCTWVSWRSGIKDGVYSLVRASSALRGRPALKGLTGSEPERLVVQSPRPWMPPGGVGSCKYQPVSVPSLNGCTQGNKVSLFPIVSPPRSRWVSSIGDWRPCVNSQWGYIFQETLKVHGRSTYPHVHYRDILV